MDYSYKEVVIGSLSKGSRFHSKIVHVNDLHEIQAEAFLSNKEVYFSYFNYSEDIIAFHKKHSSVKQYPGLIAIDKIYLDFDCSLDNFLQYIKNVPKEYSQVFFSGSGFHIHLENLYGLEPSENLHLTLRSTLIKDFPASDKIYDKTRIFRAPNTINKKTNLYKIPLKFEELTNIEDIQKLAIAPRGIAYNPENVRPIWKNRIVAPTFTSDSFTPTNTPKSSKSDYTQIATCVHKMFDEGPIAGSRHNKIMRMASVYRRSGIPESGIANMLVSWSKLPEYEVNNIVKGVFKTPLEYGCNDALMSNYCDSQCIFYKNKNLVVTKNIHDLEKDFLQFIAQDSGNVLNLKPYLNLKSDYSIYPGEFVIVIGDTGIGKTAFMQNLCVSFTQPTLYLSLEVTSHLLFRRFAQINKNMTKTQLLGHYSSNLNGITHGLEHIKCQFVSPKLDNLASLIASTNSKIVIIDTLDGIHIPNTSSGIEQTERLAVVMKELAQVYNLIIFGIHHISKQASFSGTLNVHSGKGSSSLEQKADKVISIEGEKNNASRIIKSLKARDENSFSTEMNYNTETFRYENILLQR